MACTKAKFTNVLIWHVFKSHPLEYLSTTPAEMDVNRDSDGLFQQVERWAIHELLQGQQESLFSANENCVGWCFLSLSGRSDTHLLKSRFLDLQGRIQDLGKEAAPGLVLHIKIHSQFQKFL
jgi:hypothetical protein